MEIPLSYSRLSLFEQCPMKFKATHIDKLSELAFQENEATKRGKTLHSQLEAYTDYLNDQSMAKPILSSAAQTAVPIIDRLFNTYSKLGVVLSEKQFAIDTSSDMKKCGWFDKSGIMYRGIFDLLILTDNEAIILDHKSGKVRDYEASPTGQLRMAAWMIFKLYPKIQNITAGYVFLDHPESNPHYENKVAKVTKVSFSRDEEADMDATFRKAYDEVQAETEWPAKKNKHCYFCPLKDGDCIYG